MPTGWDRTPGARGCTPQSCSYRDDEARFAALGDSVFGVSSQSHTAQAEFVDREHIPFLLLNDPNLKLAAALRLPTFEVDGSRLFKRVSLLVRVGRIEHVRYPVFLPLPTNGRVGIGPRECGADLAAPGLFGVCETPSTELPAGLSNSLGGRLEDRP